MMQFRIYVINLVTRPDRRKQIEQELSRINWRADFFSAERPADAGGFPSIGARGCFESHLSVLRLGLAQDQHLAILEDDLNFSRGFSERWTKAWKDLPDNWSILYPAPVERLLEQGLVRVSPDTGILCAHFVLFHRRVIPLIIRELETIRFRPPGHPLGGPMHVDGAYSTIRKQNRDLNTYVCSPPLGYQSSSESDIDVTARTRMKLVRRLLPIPLLRKIKSQFRRLS